MRPGEGRLLQLEAEERDIVLLVGLSGEGEDALVGDLEGILEVCHGVRLELLLEAFEAEFLILFVRGFEDAVGKGVKAVALVERQLEHGRGLAAGQAHDGADRLSDEFDPAAGFPVDEDLPVSGMAEEEFPAPGRAQVAEVAGAARSRSRGRCARPVRR